MQKEIIIDVGTDETRVALLEDGNLAEIHIERPFMERLLGNIYRGKVLRVLPGIQAAFVDIGYEKNAFLYAGEVVLSSNHFSKIERDEDDDVETNSIFAYEGKNHNHRHIKIEEVIKVGNELTVQVIKEPTGNKGPRVSTNITLPGRNLVLLPKSEYVAVSRRIEDEKEKDKLKEMAKKIKPSNMGLIVRTVSVQEDEDAFKKDVNFLVKLWEKIEKSEQSGNVPRCLHKDLSLVYRVVRDILTDDIKKVVVNDEETYATLLELIELTLPSLKKRVEYFTKDYELFDYYRIDAAIGRALSRKVWLKSGGYLVFDQTEALTVVDVNTGKYVGVKNHSDTVVKINIEAAEEIAKQLRLRDIGGIIIIDFIDMVRQEDKDKVIEVLKEALKKDKTKAVVVGITGLGLVEMTRKKTNHRLSNIMHVDCPICDGSGKVSKKVEIKT